MLHTARHYNLMTFMFLHIFIFSENDYFKTVLDCIILQYLSYKGYP